MWEDSTTNLLEVNAYDSLPDFLSFPWNEIPLADYPTTANNLNARLAARAYKSNGYWQMTIYSYDVNGLVAEKTILTEDAPTNPGKITLQYTYDTQGRLLSRFVNLLGSLFNLAMDSITIMSTMAEVI